MLIPSQLESNYYNYTIVQFKLDFHAFPLVESVPSATNCECYWSKKNMGPLRLDFTVDATTEMKVVASLERKFYFTVWKLDGVDMIAYYHKPFSTNWKRFSLSNLKCNKITFIKNPCINTCLVFFIWKLLQWSFFQLLNYFRGIAWYLRLPGSPIFNIEL